MQKSDDEDTAPLRRIVHGSYWICLKEKICRIGVINETMFKEAGIIQKYKVRMLAKGYSQQPGVEHETFEPVVRIGTIRKLLALVAQLELEVFQLDVKSVF